ncbi:Dihydrolipoyllysine-residue acetyltransferase component of pyruvate dehydrogenase complex [Fusarium oxysporum f. sp. albedinis]|nr:Dihydrolipoyllysine-residue acetyltransferase component of pyruvate dehydrogenase complex [Fusarium oxysporum f. sp. albedinis]
MPPKSNAPVNQTSSHLHQSDKLHDPNICHECWLTHQVDLSLSSTSIHQQCVQTSKLTHRPLRVRDPGPPHTKAGATRG